MNYWQEILLSYGQMMTSTLLSLKKYETAPGMLPVFSLPTNSIEKIGMNVVVGLPNILYATDHTEQTHIFRI